MRRQLLAFLAILTGLAALGTPAHAAASDGLMCEVGASAFETEGSVQERQACDEEQVHAPSKGPGETLRPAKKPKRIMRPPVLFGVDRAYE